MDLNYFLQNIFFFFWNYYIPVIFFQFLFLKYLKNQNFARFHKIFWRKKHNKIQIHFVHRKDEFKNLIFFVVILSRETKGPERLVIIPSMQYPNVYRYLISFIFVQFILLHFNLNLTIKSPVLLILPIIYKMVIFHLVNFNQIWKLLVV